MIHGKKSVSFKMGMKENGRVIFVDAPAEAKHDIDPPSLKFATKLTGEFDFILFFARCQADLRKKFLTLKTHLKPTGMLWISWPKTGKLNTDLKLPLLLQSDTIMALLKANVSALTTHGPH